MAVHPCLPTIGQPVPDRSKVSSNQVPLGSDGRSRVSSWIFVSKIWILSVSRDYLWAVQEMLMVTPLGAHPSFLYLPHLSVHWEIFWTGWKISMAPGFIIAVLLFWRGECHWSREQFHVCTYHQSWWAIIIYKIIHC